jgi:hypothetical protein
VIRFFAFGYDLNTSSAVCSVALGGVAVAVLPITVVPGSDNPVCQDGSKGRFDRLPQR